MLSRLGASLLFLTLVALALAYVTDYTFHIPLDKAVRADLSAAASPGRINIKILDALERDDIEDADMYADIGKYMGYEIPADTLRRLDEAHSMSATVVRNTWEFGTGFVTGEGDSTAGLAGAVTSDLTVIGDVRDIATEGGKWLTGQPYNELVIGLSMVGIAATGLTVATGGGGIVVKAGVSIMKAAKRAGKLTKEFGELLLRMTRDAVNMPALREALRTTDLTDLAKTQRVLTDYAKTVRGAEIFPVLSRIGDMNKAVGPAETIRLMKFVKNGENLEDVALMTERFGTKTRGIIELTGKASLRAFKTALRAVEFIAKYVIWFFAWIGGLAAMTLMRGIRLFVFRRAT
ncbi:MAG: hypothetical protein GC190_01180 [Alphaproteobacteria bacterium]|nr:hypothetical protein [Alphaproteobacteria bacterium]